MSARKIFGVTDHQTYWRFSNEVIITGYKAIAPEVIPGEDLPPPIPLDHIPEVPKED